MASPLAFSASLPRVALPPPARLAGGRRRRAPAAVRAKVREIFMPALSSTMTEGRIVSWIKSEGDKLSKGESVVVVESDKADMDVETFYDGYLASILVPAGESAPVGATIAFLAEFEEEIPLVRARSQSPPPAATAPAPAATAPPPTAPAAKAVATPHARKLAKQHNIDINLISGTGPHGRITGDDILIAAGVPSTVAPLPSPPPPAAAIPSPPKPSAASSATGGAPGSSVVPFTSMQAAPGSSVVPFTSMQAAPGSSVVPFTSMQAAPGSSVVPFTSMQAAVSRNMVESLTVPTFRVGYSLITDALDALYEKVKSKGVTMTVLLAKAVAMALAQHPVVNSTCTDGKSIKHNSNVNVAVAVAIDGGLITPVLQDADKLDIYLLSQRWKDLLKKARAKQLQPSEYNSGTFSLSNLGMFGVDRFDAILPPGQGAIMAVGASKPTVITDSDGLFSVKNKMLVNVTADHRIIYGADLAAFLQTFSKIIENPESLTL